MTDSEIYENNLKHFQVTRRSEGRAQCKCPAHPDKQASLTVSKGKRCTLLHCHAGCSLENILAAAGLEKKDIFYELESREINWKHYVESREKRKIEAVYNYVSCNDGSYLFTKIRLQGKKMLFGILENNRFSYGLKGQSKKQLKAIYGSLEAIRKAIKEGRPIFIPEGERDCDTLKKQGYTAFTYGGVNDWQSDFAGLLRDAHVIILVVASEPPRRMLFDSSLVKTLTGRDTVSARFLHENEFQFKPKFKLILNSNYLPVINDKTVFSSNRVKVVPFERHFTEKEQNKHLKEQLQQEIDGILNWCIKGLQLYRKEGLEPPVAVQNATHEYSEDSDKVGKFISECLVKSDQNLAAKDVYEKYSRWCTDCGLGVDGRTSFYEELKTKNLLSKTATVTGKTVKNVIKGYSFAEETFHFVDKDLDTPFS